MIFALKNVKKFLMTACNHAHAMTNRVTKSALLTTPRALLNVPACLNVGMDAHVTNMNAETIRFMISVYMSWIRFHGKRNGSFTEETILGGI